MSFLPIVARELRVSARKRGTFWLRVSAAVAAIVLGTWWFLMNQNSPRNQLAVPMFGIMTGSTALYCLLSGLWFTADCLSRENREGTLGLLFLTDLRGYDVVLGKLAATSLGALYGVLAVVPMLGVPLLIGGVTPGEFGRMALVILNTLFFSLTLGLAVSAMSLSGRKATAIMLLLILLFAIVPPVTASILEAFRKWSKAQELLLLPSPLFTFAMAFDAQFRTMNLSFWWSLGIVHGLGWIFLGTASVVARHSWQDRPRTTSVPRWPARWWPGSDGDAEDRRSFRRELLDTNAFFWLAARARRRPAQVWGVLGVLALIWAGLLVRLGREDWLNSAVYLMTGLTLNSMIKVWVAAESCRQLAEERQDGTLELLLSTSLAVPDILRGQWLAMARQFLAPVLVIQGILLTFMLSTLHDLGPDDDPRFIIWFYSMGMVMLLLDSLALYWLGMWRGLTAKSPQRAFYGNALRILIVPWVALGIAALLLAMAAATNRYEPGGYTWFNLWLLFGVAVDLGFAAWARFKLHSEFRIAAAGRFDSRTVP